ncbi:MAG: translation initiation factor IF-2 [Nanoarchaeota archaeon]|nr:translation initiation factor IF-2 [Nanoarchaeota archaeon]MBU1501228.1 translation initiation factor IF-2 [Nanoarchaeota archaeon]
MAEKATIKSPIVTVCGHVDHGKTSILDSLRGSSVQSGESGGITQKISFTLYPADKLKSTCPLIEKSGIHLTIPGFLFIDTPGHAAFTNLRKRGGGLADLAVLVIDINEGIKPQTAEVIQILKQNKTPFVIALNKIDNVSGWRTPSKEKKGEGLQKSIETQPSNVKQNFDEKYLTLVGSLQSHGFDADLFYKVEDFTKKVALVPCSARTQEGIPELVMVLCGLSQKYLGEKITLGNVAKGVVLEIKKERDNSYLESILYDGELAKSDTIAIANISGSNQEEPIISRIRVLEEIRPLSEKFQPKEKVTAATGVRMQIIEKANVLPGMPFVVFKDNLEEVKKIFKQQITENIKTDKQGIIAKADSLGSLEALLSILKQEKISVVKAGIGSISKSDIISAKANLKISELDAIIVGFNVSIDEEAGELLGQNKKIKIMTDDVIYKLVDDLKEFRIQKKKEIEKKRMMDFVSLAKVKVLHNYVFRNTSPAIFGVRVEVGKITSRMSLIDGNNEKVGNIKNLQAENKSVEEAGENQELAISIPGINFERRMKEVDFLYSEIGESQFKNFRKNKDLLSQKEISLLQEIAEIKRKGKADWGGS